MQYLKLDFQNFQDTIAVKRFGISKSWIFSKPTTFPEDNK